MGGKGLGGGKQGRNVEVGIATEGSRKRLMRLSNYCGKRIMQGTAAHFTSRWMAFTLTCFSVPEGTRIFVKLLSMRGQNSGPGRSVAPST